MRYSGTDSPILSDIWCIAQLMGYADGSFGGAQKAMMQRIAKKLSPEEIQAVAAHIATF